MNQIRLLQDLVHRLTELFKGYSLPNKAGVLQEVQVFAQYLPQPEGLTLADKSQTGLKSYGDGDYESNFPCIIVKLVDQTDEEERGNDGSRVTVKILTGIYDEGKQCQGYVDVLNIQEKIRAYLLEYRVLVNKYLLLMPLVSKLIETETWPVYFGEQTMTYIVARPVQDSEWIYQHKRSE